MIFYQLDTNAILRYLTQDKKIEAGRVNNLLERAQKKEVAIEISEPVMIETVIVLQNYYKFPKEKIVRLMEAILSIDWIVVENLQFITQAISIFSQTSLDLVDCLILVRAKAKNQQILTFDRALSAATKDN